MALFMAVIGRMHGDPEDTVRMYETDDVAMAAALFKQDIQARDNVSDEELAIAESNGDGIYVNAVLCSAAPIEQVA